MPHKPITGLSHQQFTTLLTALNNHLTWIKPDQKPRKLTLAQALKIPLLYHRHNLTEELLAGFHDVSQPTISRTVNLIEQALVKILRPLIQPLEKALDTPGSLVIYNKLRAVVEPVIAQIKTWRVLHSVLRWPLGVYGRVFSVVKGLVFLAATAGFGTEITSNQHARTIYTENLC